MQTQVQNPQAIFNMPQRLVVPLFQRPYVWSEELQWAPLWSDVERLSEKLLAGDSSARHFLGAVVIQQEPNSIGTLITRMVIDGQQRLTTLQLLFDAVHEEAKRAGLPNVARRIADLVENPEHQWREPEDRFKVWPTNRDRGAFAEAMSTETPDHGKLQFKREKIVQAHEYFSRMARAWLAADPMDTETRASVLVDALSTRLQMVVIELTADEDAQEIFETLNARGTPLTAADLIKNFVFRRLDAAPEESEKVYHEYWADFETVFWEQEVSSGRVLWSRSSLFLTQWLTSQTRKDTPAREVFSSFKHYVEDSDQSIREILAHIRDCAQIYRALAESTADHHKPLSTVERFAYRTGTMQSELLKPIVIWLTDPTLPSIPDAELSIALDSLESWLVRRMFVREKSAGHNRFLVDLLARIADGDRTEVGTRIRDFLAEQTADASYWPDDDAVRRSLEDFPIYRRFNRGRVRMLLEALEDHARGFRPGSKGAFGEQPVVRDECTIEHVLPQRWEKNWPLAENTTAEDREALVHTLGNLTLVSKALNPSMSNAAWAGDKGKREALNAFSSIKITATAVDEADTQGGWSETLIENRTQSMIDGALAIWPVPVGHSNVGRHSTDKSADLTLEDLIAAGMLQYGDTLVSTSSLYPNARATIVQGGLRVGEVTFQTLSGAGRAEIGRNVNGWTFWRLEGEGGVRMGRLRKILRANAVTEADEALADDDDDEQETTT
jgi:hypothetical protein